MVIAISKSINLRSEYPESAERLCPVPLAFADQDARGIFGAADDRDIGNAGLDRCKLLGRCHRRYQDRCAAVNCGAFSDAPDFDIPA